VSRVTPLFQRFRSDPTLRTLSEDERRSLPEEESLLREEAEEGSGAL
jgi:hypothetical protein